MTLQEQALEVFYATVREKYEENLPDKLVEQWFEMSLREIQTELYAVDDDTEGAEINVLGLMIYRRYLRRELSRVNRLNNIITRDIKLNATGDTKKALLAEFDGVTSEIRETIHKLKQHAF